MEPYLKECEDRLSGIRESLESFREVEVLTADDFQRHSNDLKNLGPGQFSFIKQILICYKSAVQLLKSQAVTIAGNERIIAEKDDKFKLVHELEEKNMKMLENQLEESKNRLGPLPTGLGGQYVKDRHKHGSFTRAQAWQRLISYNGVRKERRIPTQAPEKTRKSLNEALLKNSNKWSKESDMYEDIVNAMKILYPDTDKRISVQGTFNHGFFRADISVASQFDRNLPSAVLYFIELKGITTGDPKGDEYCGQILDYFNNLHDAQESRSKFVAILSNGKSSWVFEARYDGSNVTITEQPANDLADAIMYADTQSKKQYDENCIPDLDEQCFGNQRIITLREKHTLLSVERLRGKVGKGAEWQDPFGSRIGSKVFVLKARSKKGGSLDNEIRILGKIRSNLQLRGNADFLHVPQLVWETKDQLGIMPCGRPINLDDGEPTSISRRIVEGLMDGLQFLHAMSIIHRDIRPSNLILFGTDHKCHVVIIDYETAVDNNRKTCYEGGWICQPKHLLQHHLNKRGVNLRSGTSTGSESRNSYTPRIEHDLCAAILVVLHLLFPRWFRQFPVELIGENSTRTREVCDLWDHIEHSEIWKPYVKAVQDMNDDVYEKLKKMADVFCALPPVSVYYTTN